MTPSPTTMMFSVLPGDGRHQVRLLGELDIATVPILSETLDTLRRDEEVVTIDLAGLSFMDVSGLRALETYAATLNGSGPLVLKNVPWNIRRVFALTGADANPSIELRGNGRG